MWRKAIVFKAWVCHMMVLWRMDLRLTVSSLLSIQAWLLEITPLALERLGIHRFSLISHWSSNNDSTIESLGHLSTAVFSPWAHLLVSWGNLWWYQLTSWRNLNLCPPCCYSYRHAMSFTSSPFPHHKPTLSSSNDLLALPIHLINHAGMKWGLTFTEEMINAVIPFFTAFLLFLTPAWHQESSVAVSIRNTSLITNGWSCCLVLQEEPSSRVISVINRDDSLQ